MDFPGNSHNPLGDNKQISPKETKEEAPKKDIQKVVSTDAVQRPKSIGRRFKALFSGGEAKGALKYIVADVMIPALRNLVVDATTKGVERIVYGNSPPRRYEPGRPRVSYNSPSVVDRYARRPGMLPDQPPYSRGRRQEVSEIILTSREDAELVVERLTDIIDKYDVASVADLHELVGLPSSHVDNKWGWSVLTYANVRQIREGYLIDLPPAEPI